MIKMTKAQALKIQAEQTNYYAGIYGEQVREMVAAATTADRLEDGVEYDVVTINRHIPRGGWFEWNIPQIRQREEAIRHRPRDTDSPRKGIA